MKIKMVFKSGAIVDFVADSIDRESRHKPLPLGMGSRRGKYKMIK